MDELLQIIAAKGSITTPAGDLLLNYGSLIEKVVQAEKYCVHRAIGSGCLELLGLFLKFHASPNQVDIEGDTPLHKVAQLDDFGLAYSMAQLLINAGANVLVMNFYGLSSHCYAVRRGNIVLLRLLLRNGIDHGIGRLVLIEAAAAQNLSMVKMLMEATPHLSPKDLGACLHYSIYDNAELVQLLIDSGADIDAVDPESDSKPLNAAATSGNPETVKILLNACADINHVCDLSDTPSLSDSLYKPGSALHDAVFEGHIEVVELLLKHKADVNSLNYFGESVLYLAAKQRDYYRNIDEETYLKILDLLLSHGADMYRYGECGNCFMPFKMILKEGKIDAVRLFLKYGATFDEACLDDELGETVLHLAAQNENTDVLEFALTQRPNDINQFSFSCHTPLSVAVIDNTPAKVEMLIKYGADVNCLAIENSRRSPLYLGVSMGRCESIQVLLDNGADIDYSTKTNENMSILALALSCTFNSAFKVIVEHIALLEMKSVFVDPKNYSLMKSTEKVWKYYEKCQSELVRMQDSVVDGQVTFSRILVDKDIIGYARNQHVISIFENQSIEKIFPVYGSRISKRMKEARKRVKLLDDATRGLSSLLYLDVSSYYIVYENILKYVSEEDLHALSELKQDSSSVPYSPFSPYFQLTHMITRQTTENITEQCR